MTAIKLPLIKVLIAYVLGCPCLFFYNFYFRMAFVYFCVPFNVSFLYVYSLKCIKNIKLSIHCIIQHSDCHLGDGQHLKVSFWIFRTLGLRSKCATGTVPAPSLFLWMRRTEGQGLSRTAISQSRYSSNLAGLVGLMMVFCLCFGVRCTNWLSRHTEALPGQHSGAYWWSPHHFHRWRRSISLLAKMWTHLMVLYSNSL